MGVNRRKLLLAAGVTVAALGAEGARQVWARIAADVPPSASLEARHVAIITALANTILPATETPGAIDVGVPAWVAYVLSESFEPVQRQSLLGSLDAIDERARAEFGRGIAELAPEQLEALIDPLDRRGRFEEFADRAARVVAGRISADGALGDLAARFGQERRGFQQLKSLIVHGYFTSEPVQRELMVAHGA